MKRKGILALAVLAAVLSAVRYAPMIEDPWDLSMESVIPTTYYGRVEQCFQRFGFGALEGQPHLYKLPTAAGATPEELAGLVYVRHPVLSYWITHAVVEIAGWSERSFRLAPILFSSLSGAILVLILGRFGSLSAAVAGLLLWLTLPMSLFVGWMSGYEAFTMAPMLAAFVLHVRLREKPPAAYAFTWVAVFVAGLFDWIGPAVFASMVVYEIALPRAERRCLGRAFSCLVPAALSIAASFALLVFWSGSVGAALQLFLESAHRGTAETLRSYDLAGWFATQGSFWKGMFTLPIALVAAAALPWLVIRLRSATDALPRIAVALLVPAVLNVLAFRTHAFIHDYWWYYALPYAILATVIVLRDLSARLGARAGGVAFLAGAALLSGFAAWQDWSRHEHYRTTEYRDLGRDFNRFAGRNDALLYVSEFENSCFYLRCWYMDVLGSSSLEALAGIRGFKRAGKLVVDRVVVLVPDGTSTSIRPANAARLREVATVRHLDREAFEAEAPALARKHPGGGLWVLTIE